MTVTFSAIDGGFFSFLPGTTPLRSQASYLTGIQQSARVGALLVHILLRLSDLTRVAFSIPPSTRCWAVMTYDYGIHLPGITESVFPKPDDKSYRLNEKSSFRRNIITLVLRDGDGGRLQRCSR